jgi:hypothetical protein
MQRRLIELSGRLLALSVLAATALAAPARAQDLERLVEGPKAPWRVIETEHFRVYYPQPAAAWAEGAAARLEAVRERLVEEIGYAPEQVVDVVVSDPVAQPNGFALPFLGRPRMVLWTRPPSPDSVIGHYRDWGELLVVHETAHLVHLLRPSRNPTRRLLARLLPLGPISRQAPRWVTEGYATLIEGRLTGTGRPHGDLRAAILRRWAMAGKLPSYGALTGDGSYLGQSMAYLAGSAYLDWLEERGGRGDEPRTLRHLWARMTARQPRSFEESFAGVFGDSPADLWDRFRAELAWQAFEVERRVEAAGGFVEGEAWMDLSWQTGGPALSPDGERLALVLRGRDQPPELAVFSTAVDEEALEKRAERRAEILERDPEDVLAVDTAPPPRRRLHTLPTIDFAPPADPRWLPDGESLLLVRTLPDEEGFLHPDLFRWTPPAGDATPEVEATGRGRLERLTVAADLTQPDPAPDGTWAAAVESRHGATRLVRVELASGTVTAITEAAVEVVVDRPRVAPDGERLVYARHAAGRWGLVVHRLADGAEEELPLPAGATVAAPAWGRGAEAGTVFASLGVGGFIDVHAFAPAGGRARSGGEKGSDDNADGEAPSPGGEIAPAIGEAGGGWERRRLTRTRGAAFAPEPGDGELFFLSLEPDGLDLRRLGAGGSAPVASHEGEADATAPAVASPPPLGDLPDLAGLSPVVRPEPVVPPPPPTAADLPPSRPYGVGRQELFFLSGGSEAPSNRGMELGVRGGDLLGRLDWIVTAGLGDAALAEGGAVAAAWRGPTPGLPLNLSVHLFSVRERPSRQPDEVPGLGRQLDVDREGVELVAAWQRRTRPGPLRLAGGAYLGEVDPVLGPQARHPLDERALFAEADWRPRWSRGEVAWGLGLAGRAETAETGDTSWVRLRGEVGAGLRYDGSSLAVAWTGGQVDEDAPGWQRFALGGVSSSLLPGTVEAARVLVPALPQGTKTGGRFSALRVDLDLEILPLPLFWARYDVSGRRVSGFSPPGIDDPISLAGAEWRLDLGPVPLVRLPAIELTLGAAYVFDPPFEDDVNGWIAVTWRP